MRPLLLGILLAGITTVGAANPPGIPPPDRAWRFEHDGEVTAVDRESLTARVYDLYTVPPPGGRNYEYGPSADGKGWWSAGERQIMFGKNGRFDLGCRHLTVNRVEGALNALTLFPVDGPPETLRLADQPARRFLAFGKLAGGGYKNGSASYRLADIQVGDRVWMLCFQRLVVDYVDQVQITRRPGGRVPRSPGDTERPPPPSRPPYHERMNAEQDWEEHGIPIPYELHPGGPQASVAPMPREAKPKPPAR